MVVYSIQIMTNFQNLNGTWSSEEGLEMSGNVWNKKHELANHKTFRWNDQPVGIGLKATFR